MKKIELDNDVRVRIDNQVMSLLKPIPKGNYYKEKLIKDKNLMGLELELAQVVNVLLFLDTDPRVKMTKVIILKK